MPDYQFAELAAAPRAPLLFLFHGTGGDENDLLALGAQLMPSAHLVSPRGDVSENGALRFFKRAGMGVYDMDDLARATTKMSDFMRKQIDLHAPSSVAALGYSNGANILASVLFAAPDLVRKRCSCIRSSRSSLRPSRHWRTRACSSRQDDRIRWRR